MVLLFVALFNRLFSILLISISISNNNNNHNNNHKADNTCAKKAFINETDNKRKDSSTFCSLLFAISIANAHSREKQDLFVCVTLNLNASLVLSLRSCATAQVSLSVRALLVKLPYFLHLSTNTNAIYMYYSQ